MNAADILIMIILVFGVVQSIDYVQDSGFGQDYLDEKDESLNSFLYSSNRKGKEDK